MPYEDVPGSNIRRWFGPRGNYIGFDNYGSTRPNMPSATDQNGLMPMAPPPQALHGPTMEGPSDEDLLMQQYSQPEPYRGEGPFRPDEMTRQATKSAVDRLSGNQEIMPLDRDPMMRDARFQQMLRMNPKVAQQLFSQARGYSTDDANLAQEYGYRQLSQLRMAMDPERFKRDNATINMLEDSLGVKGGVLAQDVRDLGNGVKSGWDASSGIAHVPGGQKWNGIEFEPIPPRQVPIDPQTVNMLREIWKRRTMRGGVMQAQTQMPQAQPAVMSARQKQDELTQLRQLREMGEQGYLADEMDRLRRTQVR